MQQEMVSECENSIHICDVLPRRLYDGGDLEPMEKHPNFASYLFPQDQKRNPNDIIFREISLSRLRK
jgi:hypothetical protein